MENIKRIRRGDIYYTNIEDIGQAVGSEQSGSRPAVVIQNDVGNKYSPTTIVAFITTKPKKYLPTHVRLHTKMLFFSSTVMLEQIRTVSKDRLEKYIGTLNKAEMEKIDRAICVSLDIKET
ncbi:mRNA interferase MazF [Ruminococcus sp. YE71]|uniref:type II toxin-antitoxin system PemK/MazF family toxin n=1 Tax=unclassified Ruminococcus TaxID=2608920 RepID=UPI00087F635A|nr:MULTISPECIES: type II toxin-antitoxin system PemK/MazF family toxin [unclassified Ruminococcus]SDA31248.1 mRNA interferase MazF [Ruminococcus sp. YE78]SFW51277.1 mRNA interferase MazF [Ruminococcus sp. YE71]